MSLKKTSRAYPASRFVFFIIVIVYSSCLVTLCFPKICCYLNIYSNCFYQNETLIAIKAPHGTTLEVPDPDEVNEEQRRLIQEVHFVILLAKFSIQFFFFLICTRLLTIPKGGTG